MSKLLTLDEEVDLLPCRTLSSSSPSSHPELVVGWEHVSDDISSFWCLYRVCEEKVHKHSMRNQLLM